MTISHFQTAKDFLLFGGADTPVSQHYKSNLLFTLVSFRVVNLYQRNAK